MHVVGLSVSWHLPSKCQKCHHTFPQSQTGVLNSPQGRIIVTKPHCPGGETEIQRG